MTRVFPDPAPARTSCGPSPWVATAICSGFRVCSRSKGARRIGVECGGREAGWQARGAPGVRLDPTAPLRSAEEILGRDDPWLSAIRFRPGFDLGHEQCPYPILWVEPGWQGRLWPGGEIGAGAGQRPGAERLGAPFDFAEQQAPAVERFAHQVPLRLVALPPARGWLPGPPCPQGSAHRQSWDPAPAEILPGL